MEKSSLNNKVNKKLVKGALIFVDNDVFTVIDINTKSILVYNKEHGKKSVKDDEWVPIKLSEKWLDKFNLKVNTKFNNIFTNTNFIIKSTGKNLYLTAVTSQSAGDNPVIPLNFVHELQEWYFKLTKRSLVLCDT